MRNLQQGEAQLKHRVSAGSIQCDSRKCRMAATLSSSAY